MYYSLQPVFCKWWRLLLCRFSWRLFDRGKIEPETLSTGLDAIAGVKEVTLILFPDAMNLSTAEDYLLHKCHCPKL